MAGKPIVISILGDSRDLVRSLGESESRLGKLGRIAGVTGKAVGAAFIAAGAAAGTFALAAVKSASDAQQSIGATETVFGKYADAVVKDSDRAAKQFGLSANEYRESANLIGSLFKNQGVALDQLGGKTKNMIGTASDLAATFGGTTSDAVAALSSAFKGEFDPLERYGISIKQSTINAELAAKGQDKLTGAALKAAQQQATTRLIMDQAGASLGAFGRETGTLAHQQQVLGAQWENLKAKAGAALLPVLTRLATTVNDKLFPAIEAAVPPVLELGRQAGDFLAPVLETVRGIVEGFVPVFQTYAETAQTQVLPALLAVGTFLMTTLGPVLQDVAGVILNDVIPVIVSLATFFYGQVIPAIVEVAGKVAENLAPVITTLADVIRTNVIPTVQKIAAKFQEWMPAIQRVTMAVVKVTGFVLTLASAILAKVLPPLIRFAAFLITNVVSAVVAVIGVVIKVIDHAVRFGSTLVDIGKKVVTFASGVIDTIKGLPGKILGALGDLGSLLLDAGRDLIQGLINGIKDKLASVDIGGMVKDAIGGVGDVLGSVFRMAADVTVVTGPATAGGRNAPIAAPGFLDLADVLEAEKKRAEALRRERRAFTKDAIDSAAATASARALSVRVTLDAEQLDAIERGRRVRLDLKAYETAGGTL